MRITTLGKIIITFDIDFTIAYKVIMNRIALQTKVYRIMQASCLLHSETLKGDIQRKMDPDYEDSELTKIEFAVDQEKVGIVIIPTPLQDVREYFEAIERDGKVVEFDMTFVTRKAEEHELSIIRNIIADVQRSKGKKKKFRPYVV